METCSVDGCVRSGRTRGLCIMHYNRVLRTGNTGSPMSAKRAYGSGSINGDGYVIVHDRTHPLSVAQGKLLAHRRNLYDAIGGTCHPCNWCGKVLPWQGYSAATCINVDHIDGNKLNNETENLVVACLDCNTKRGANA